jgi:hypothetical protein
MAAPDGGHFGNLMIVTQGRASRLGDTNDLLMVGLAERALTQAASEPRLFLEKPRLVIGMLANGES